MNVAPAAVTLGGAAAGTAILALVLQRWWMKSRKWQDLLPFVLSGLYGILAVLSAGGLLGTVTSLTLWGVNGLGDLALIYGVGGDAPPTTRARQVALTSGGHAIVLILTCLLIGAWRWSKKLPRKQVGLGALTGICLGLVRGVAGVMAVPLANFANLAGSWWTGAVQ